MTTIERKICTESIILLKKVFFWYSFRNNSKKYRKDYQLCKFDSQTKDFKKVEMLIMVNIGELKRLQIFVSEYQIILEVKQDILLFHKLFR